MDLWAAEPVLANPVAFSVDERSRLHRRNLPVSQQCLDIRHYMFMLEDDLASRSLEDRLANIRKWFRTRRRASLEHRDGGGPLIGDTDGDGVADKSTVCGGFTSPLSGIASSVLARHGEVW